MEFKKLSVQTKVSLIFVILIIVLWAIIYPRGSDTGLYHLQTMVWAEKFAVVPGLGNLHGRLAFNPSSLVLSTLFSYHPNYFPVFYPINSLCFFIFFIWLFFTLEKYHIFIRYLLVIGLFVFIVSAYGTLISSVSTDMLPNIIICYLLLRSIIDKHYFSKILPIVTISVFCITAKLSAIAITLLALYIVIQQVRQKNYKVIWAIIFLSIITILPWCIRNIIQSGYLIYPFPSIDIFSFDWKIPIDSVQAEKDSIYNWGKVRMHNEMVSQMSFAEWFPIWFNNLNKYNLGIFLAALISPFIILLNLKKLKKQPIIFFTYCIAVIGVISCFFSAPDIRFGWGFFIMAGFIPLLLLNYKFLDKRFLINIPILLFFVFFILHFSSNYCQMMREQVMIGKPYLLLYKPQRYDYLKMLENPTFSTVSVGNQEIYYPSTAEQLCYDACFPCTIEDRLEMTKGKLEMRGKTLQDGFRIRDFK
ncbi:MAG: hypothetical protein LBV43_03765 [Prevotella sp.]|nr:hypothetical protein [Prevotella sp.]